MAAAKGTCLNHLSRESPDVKRLAKFYIEMFGFEQVETPKFDFEVIWLKLGSSFYLHLIERDPNSKLPEGPWSSASAVADPKDLPRGHHLCLYVPNFDSVVQNLKVRGFLQILLQEVFSCYGVGNVHNIELSHFQFLFEGLGKGIEVNEMTRPDGKARQAFFFDPDGNGLEVTSQSPEL
ncbi:hypothetical protein Sango_2870800 [Sesamum angolense]|uniref:VOC domain-containing protein n=1 Tax=Sesamum angolense TaxID=2727404 RepID=A0AAE1T6P0_9LAMI|nr:hypothetical protein Sango_2870800 [Sesamum angolense]